MLCSTAYCIRSHRERFATSALALGIRILEGKFTREFRLFPVHHSSNHVEEGHGLHKNFDSVGLHFHVLFRLFKCIIQGVRQPVAPSPLDSQPDSDGSFCVFTLQNLLYPFRPSFRQLDRIFGFQLSSSGGLFFYHYGTGQAPALDAATGGRCAVDASRRPQKIISSIITSQPSGLTCGGCYSTAKGSRSLCCGLYPASGCGFVCRTGDCLRAGFRRCKGRNPSPGHRSDHAVGSYE
mmetsp:Transcript_23312/g.54946  ORF Transcript_23312/g.54946 Transcript_23312/m.54946 type:complete len:237 (-) Transcript_23312:181-891(-)